MAESNWVHDGTKWVYQPGGVAQSTWTPQGGFNYPIPVGTAQAGAALAANTGQFNNSMGALGLTGYVPGQIADPFWARKLIQSGQWRRQDNGGGGFWVYNQYGQRIGGYSPNGIYDSEFNAQGDWIGNGMPAGAVELVGNTQTMARENQVFNQGLARDTLNQGLYGLNLNSADNRYSVDRNTATQLQTTGMNNATQLQTTGMNNATNLEVTRLNNAQRELESLRQDAIARGDLVLRGQIEQRMAQNETQRLGLETRDRELAERIAAANMAANPENWIASAYFNAGQAAPAGALAYGSPGSEAIFGARNAAAGGPSAAVGSPAGDMTREPAGNRTGVPSGVDFNNLPWLKAVRGETQLPAFNQVAGGGVGPLGMNIPDAMQVNLGTYQKLRPSAQAMFQGAIEASGQYAPDYLEMMTRAAPRGRAGGAMRWGG